MKKILSFVGLLIIFLLLPNYVYASYDYIANNTETTYDSDSGLLVSNANDIAQTQNGYIYIGQYNGLTRYDGKIYKTIKEIEINDVTYNIDQVTCLIAINNILYIGTQYNGLIKYENKVFSFIEYSNSKYINELSLYNDTLLVSTRNGLYSITNNNIKEYSLSVGYNVISSCINKNYIHFIDSNNNCYKMNENNLEFKYSDIKYKVIYSINDVLYLGGVSGILAIIENEIITEKKVVDNQAINTILYNLGTIYIGTDNGLFSYYEGKLDEIQGIKCKSSIESIMFDYEGSLWIASSSDGISKLSKKSIESLFVKYDLKQETVNANCLYNDLLFIGTDSNLYIIDEKNDIEIENNLTSMLKGTRIRDLAVYDNKLYIATYSSDEYDIVYIDEDFNIFEIKSSDLSLSQDSKILSGLGQIRCFYSYNEYLYIRTNYGISYLKNGEFKTVSSGYRPLNLTVIDDKLYSLSEGNGIETYDFELNPTGIMPGTGGMTPLRLVKYDHKFLYSIGTQLYMYSNYSTYTLDIDSNSSIVDLKVVEDKLYAFSSSNLIVVDLTTIDYEKPTICVIGKSRGLTSGMTANSNSTFYNDTFYISSLNGCYKYNIKDSLHEGFNPKITINDIKVNGEAVNYNDSLSLDLNTNRVVIDFAVLSYLDYINYTIYYKLEGLENEYNIVSYENLNAVSYTNLDGGEYTFRMYAISEYANKSNEIELKINKDYHFYETNIFIALMAVGGIALVVGLGYLLSYFKMKSSKKRQNELKAITVEALEAIARTIDAKDPYTNGHSLRVGKYSVLIANVLGFKESSLENLYYIGLLHDIGKIGIPNSILNKPAKLTEEE